MTRSSTVLGSICENSLRNSPTFSAALAVPEQISCDAFEGHVPIIGVCGIVADGFKGLALPVVVVEERQCLVAIARTGPLKCVRQSYYKDWAASRPAFDILSAYGATIQNLHVPMPNNGANAEVRRKRNVAWRFGASDTGNIGADHDRTDSNWN